MTTFKYEGISPDGVKVTGVIEAGSEAKAASALLEKCAVITSIMPVAEKKGLEDLFPAKIKDKELSILCSQFSIILASGMPLVRCVELVAGQTANKKLKEILIDVARDVAGGYTLAQSFGEHSQFLPGTFVETVRAGEESGTLDNAFRRMEKYYDKSSKTRDKVKGALTYPIIVVVVAVIVAAIVMIKAVPMFSEVFESMGGELPMVTRILVGTSDFLIGYWAILLIVILLFVVLFRLYKTTEKGRMWDALRKVNSSPFKKINRMNGAAQFATTMSTLLSSGLPLVRALEIGAAAMSNYAMSRAVHKAVIGIEQGRGVADCLGEGGLFPELLVEMVRVGEESGNMEETLDVIGDYYDNEVNIATSRLLAVMEPAITVGLAVVTVFLLMAVYLPMFGMYGGM